LSSLANYFHTLRYLRPIQVYGRAWFKLRRPRPDLRPAPPTRGGGGYSASISTPASMLGPQRFRFLNVEREYPDAPDWQGADCALLWIYNLHYFDDLTAHGAAAREDWHRRLMQRWVEENPPGRGVGWDSYPLSRRIVNWIQWAVKGHVLSSAARHSLAVQARWLQRRIENHLQGNHLMANAKALIHAGVYFDGPEAQRWLDRGLRLCDREINEQVLPDGGHFERSPMYHAAFLEDVLDIVSILHAYAFESKPAWIRTLGRMQCWLEAMTHPDGRIAFFNDAAFGIAPRADELRAYAQHLKIAPVDCVQAPLRALEPSGFVSIRDRDFYLVCDVGPVGPDHLPAHAHADSLSFELSLGAERVFVNSGTSEYGIGAERERQRGTSAHNTLVVDGRNSSEVWAGFRVARRARARLLETRAGADGIGVSAQHDGYRRLPGNNLHRRQWSLCGNELRLVDEVIGSFGRAECFFHLHPRIRVDLISNNNVRLSVAKGIGLRMQFLGAAGVDATKSTWHPEFGVSMANRCIVARLASATLTTIIRLEDPA
jgi:uncharacterized heparinase superfamily protein